ncbi:MAG: hypothetical protein Q9162_004893 [Coniocarpon cinnabarinum]
MAPSRLFVRAAYACSSHKGGQRALSTSIRRLADEPKAVPLSSRCNDTADKYRQFMINKPLNPHMTNTTSTIANEFPSLGKDKPPADMLTNVDPNYTPKDSVPENTERMTGGTQAPTPGKGPNAELDVGEIQGGAFKVEPHRRPADQSRKRGTLESDLLFSTFADAFLGRMTVPQMQEYDRFLDENDWDLYYWATQQPSPTSRETAEGAQPEFATDSAKGEPAPAANEATASNDGQEMKRQPAKGEWQQTAGNFKPAYKPVPARWKDSQILALVRKHVLDRSAAGVSGEATVEGQNLARSVKAGGGGLGMMPELPNFPGQQRA